MSMFFISRIKIRPVLAVPLLALTLVSTLVAGFATTDETWFWLGLGCFTTVLLLSESRSKSR